MGKEELIAIDDDVTASASTYVKSPTDPAIYPLKKLPIGETKAREICK